MCRILIIGVLILAVALVGISFSMGYNAACKDNAYFVRDYPYKDIKMYDLSGSGEAPMVIDAQIQKVVANRIASSLKLKQQGNYEKNIIFMSFAALILFSLLVMVEVSHGKRDMTHGQKNSPAPDHDIDMT